MSQEKTPVNETPKPPKQPDVPAHSTEEEKARLKDFNKDGIPPGVS